MGQSSWTVIVYRALNSYTKQQLQNFTYKKMNNLTIVETQQILKTTFERNKYLGLKNPKNEQTYRILKSLNISLQKLLTT